MCTKQSFTRCLPLVFGLLSLTPGFRAQASTPKPVVDPEIVRISYLEGDVRISRGKQNVKAGGSEWEIATANLPLETGFSLVTGKGRAEIEFEDASTMYLGENSALIFRELTTIDGTPSTSISLLTGTLTLNIDTQIPFESYTIHTPTDTVRVESPSKRYMRLNSYLDALSISIFGTTKSMAAGADATLDQDRKATETFTFRNHEMLSKFKAVPNKEMVAWDQWVNGRVVSRKAALTTVMKEAGLSAPLAGLADIQSQGKFFDCAPYGTCWEPTNGWAQQYTPKDPAATGTVATSTSTTQGTPRPHLLPTLYWEDVNMFPCAPFGYEELIAMDPLTHMRRTLMYDTDWDFYPYQWAACHTGSWIYRRHRYYWVVGRHRHHHPPVHWVKAGGKTGFVPIHPHDVKGKTPENLKNGLLETSGKRNGPLHAMELAANTPVKLLDKAPKEFRNPEFVLLARSDAPRLEAHDVHDSAHGIKVGDVPRSPTMIAFDHKSQRFVLAEQIHENGRTMARIEPFSGRVDRPGSDGAGSRGSSGGDRGSSFSGGRGSSNDGGSRSSFGGSGGGSYHGSSSSGGGGGGGSFHGGGGGGGSAPSPAPSGGGGSPSGGSSGGPSGGSHK